MLKFPQAWHHVRQELLEPEDVRDIFAETGEIPELLCPDEACRKEKPKTRVSCVCCKPGEQCKSPPHFRTYPKHAHSNKCQYEVLGNHTRYVLKHKEKFRPFNPDANLLKEFGEDIDTTFLNDAYVLEYAPHEFMETVREKKQEYIKRGHDPDTATQIARCLVPQETSRLALVVDMAQKLSENGAGTREQVPLALPGRPNANYHNAFLMLASLKHYYSTPYILCGEAHVLAASGGYIIKYKNILKDYHPDFPDLPACTPINSNMYKSAFLDELNGYAASGEICSVYSFSAHDLKENTCPMLDIKRCVVIEPRTRDSIVIRKRCLKRELNSTR